MGWAQPSGLEVSLFIAVVVAGGVLPLAFGIVLTRGRADGRSRGRLVGLFAASAGLVLASVAIARVGAPIVDRQIVELTPQAHEIPTLLGEAADAYRRLGMPRHVQMVE